MINTLYLPELREMLSEGNEEELREFCTALNPARTAEFMEGLSASEAWRVLQFADPSVREQIFNFFEEEKQREILETQDRNQVASLVADMAPDDRVDLLQEVDEHVVEELLPLIPFEERRDILRLRAYPEGTAGAVMTTEVAKFSENLTVKETLDVLSREAEELETIYYLYVVDDSDHLRGVVSTRQLVTALPRPDLRLSELVETDVVAVNAMDDQEEVAQTVARYDLLAIPVVDKERVMLGIITHDDVIDVMREEATEDAHRIAAVEPLDDDYLKTPLLTLSRKRGMWLMILFFAALLTAIALDQYEATLKRVTWLVLFIPLVISSGGNSGSQSATLIITALAMGHITLKDWSRVVIRELLMGLVLGGFLSIIGYACAVILADTAYQALVIPITLMLVVICGTLCGSILPLLFQRLGLDPALMSNPFVAGIIDIAGILIYMTVALAMIPMEG